MQTIESKITGLYGPDKWDVIRPHIQDIARGQLSISDIQDMAGLTEWKARSAIDTIKEHIVVPENKVYDDPPTKVQTWLLLPDVHRPFHNEVLWGKILNMIGDMGSNLYGVILLGDFLDMFTLGSYNAESLGLLRDITVEDEYEDGVEGIDQLDEAISSSVKKIYFWGNHEDRYAREINKKDNAKYGRALMSPTEALRLRERGYKVYENYGEDYHLLGDHLEAFHGDYTNKYCAEKHLRMGGGSCIFGHSHIIQSYHKGNQASFCIGWLGDKDNKVFTYSNRLNRMKWANGFAFVYIDDNGDYYVNQVTVWNNRFYANGKQY